MKQRATEKESLYQSIHTMSTAEILQNINREDQKVAIAVQSCIPVIEQVCEHVSDRLLAGGRLFYIGAGTSGRLGIVDASECPPTFGVEHSVVIGLIAGGDQAIRKAVEFAEDDELGGWKDLQKYRISKSDVLIGIAASGTTPYVVGAIKEARKNKIFTSCITCNPDSPLSMSAEIPIEILTGPEFITGSTRMKAGTAQKLCLNMISTTVMIKLGRIEGNRMVDMQLSNEKLVDRGTKMVMDHHQVDYEMAKKHLLMHGSVRKAKEVTIE